MPRCTATWSLPALLKQLAVGAMEPRPRGGVFVCSCWRKSPCRPNERLRCHVSRTRPRRARDDNAHRRPGRMRAANLRSALTAPRADRAVERILLALLLPSLGRLFFGRLGRRSRDHAFQCEDPFLERRDLRVTLFVATYCSTRESGRARFQLHRKISIGENALSRWSALLLHWCQLTTGHG